MVSVQKPEWQLIFHRQLLRKRGTETMLLFYVMRNLRKLPVVIAVMQEQKELIPQFELALNGVAAKIPTSDNIAALQRIFYGPWVYDDLRKERYIKLREPDERQIKRMVFAEGAERVMAEAKLDSVIKELEKSRALCAKYENELRKYYMVDAADKQNDDDEEDQMDLLAPPATMYLREEDENLYDPISE